MTFNNLYIAATLLVGLRQIASIINIEFLQNCVFFFFFRMLNIKISARQRHEYPNAPNNGTPSADTDKTAEAKATLTPFWALNWVLARLTTFLLHAIPTREWDHRAHNKR